MLGPGHILLSYFVEFGMLMVERVYIDPGTKALTDALKNVLAVLVFHQ